MYNPYSAPMQFGMSNPYQMNTNKLPPQQALQANGKASIDAIQMSPNSSALVMDTTAPIIWMCVSDSIGNVTSTPYDITPHVDKPPISIDSIEERLNIIENTLKKMEVNANAKPYDTEFDAKQNDTKYLPDKRYGEYTT